ncbi:hypothetical protein TNCT_350811 [Trichonephila clavata]|uniref:Uncharacterized protein n=1 Tax=Trichonephila clavata TaxID=2740835 RepID=A0A8X6GX71_TRICU|nr:hypothetical protein TNCT_350811 [Trichonephila clavata]
MCAEPYLEGPQMLTRARRRQLEEQSRNRAPPGERIPDRHALIVDLEPEAPGQPEPYDEEAVSSKGIPPRRIAWHIRRIRLGIWRNG